MRIYIDNMESFFKWLDENSFRYAVLRSFEGLEKNYPRYAAKEDIDIMVDDQAVELITKRYGKLSKWRGIKCDIYSTHTGYGADYLNHTIFPENLCEKILSRRRMWKNRFFVPSAEDHLYSLLYHVAYHKCEPAGFPFEDGGELKQSKYLPVLDELSKELGISFKHNLMDFHTLMHKKGYGVTYERLIDYIINDFRRGKKSYFLAVLADDFPGEMNLFVLRKVAIKSGVHKHLIEELSKSYTIIMKKDIPWHLRFKNSKHMRGNKWRFGGKPYIALIVYDKNPIETTDEDRTVHPFVFNGSQFIKRDLREWVSANAKIGRKDNALHSTDNEAEAIGHLPLFFTAEEQKQIFSELNTLRYGDSPAETRES